MSSVVGLATALDHGDFATARRWLSTSCVYTISGMTHVGPDAIVDSYERNEKWARASFDSLESESSVRHCDDGAFVISYVDRIQHAGKELVHRCEQRVEVDADRLVCKIDHHDLPGESEALSRFLDEVGVSREGS